MAYINAHAMTTEDKQRFVNHYHAHGHHHAMWYKMLDLADILRGRWGDLERGWHYQQQIAHKLHPVIYKAVMEAPPVDWHLLILEWPHVSETDPTRLAYTRSNEHGKANRQTVTTISKYLVRHFPLLSDHKLRDLAAAYNAGKCYILREMGAMLDALQRGPGSCMKWGDCCNDRHPYNVYQPDLGWGLAVRENNGDIVARALVYEGSAYHMPAEPYYVRSFHKDPNGGYSHSDTMLEAWLKQQGYVHLADYEGALMAYIPHKSTFLAPYIDGGLQEVNIVTVRAGENHRQVLQVTDGGDYSCANTNGLPDEASEDDFYCDCCGEYYHDDDRRSVGYHEDYEVCTGCRDHYYTLGLGRNGREYYFHNDDAIWVEGLNEYVHGDYLGDNGVVCDVDGDYQSEDDCVLLDGEWYPTDHDDVVTDVDGNYQLEANCVEVGGDWYRNDDERVCEDRNGDWVLVSDMDNNEANEEE